MRARYFYLEDGVNKVDLMDVCRLATFAVTLEPSGETNDVNGYCSALNEYMINNKDHILFNSYTLLDSDLMGKDVLYNNIGFCLCEKSFRIYGATDRSIQNYVSFVNRYHELLDENLKLYAIDGNQRKSR